MTLNPGDAVGESCEQLGHFPAGVVTNHDALDFVPPTEPAGQVFDSTKAANYREMFKEQWTENGDTWNSEVCNAGFGTLRAPLICSLRKVKEPEPPAPDPSQLLLHLLDTYATYTVSTSGPLGLTSDRWHYVYNSVGIRPPPEGTYQGPSATFVVDVTTGTMTYTPGIMGSFYQNQSFGCTITVELTARAVGQSIVLDYVLTVSYTNDNGTVEKVQTGSVSPATQITLTDSETVPWIGDQGGAGFLSKSFTFSTYPGVSNI